MTIDDPFRLAVPGHRRVTTDGGDPGDRCMSDPVKTVTMEVVTYSQGGADALQSAAVRATARFDEMAATMRECSRLDEYDVTPVW
jgi:hypothetical protein